MDAVPTHRGRASVLIRGRAPRRKVIWSSAGASNGTVLTNADTIPVDVLAGLEAGGVGIVGGTVVRSHIWLSLASLGTDTNPSAVTGLIVYDKTAVAAGRPAVATDNYADWLHLRYISPGTNPNTVFSTPAVPAEYLYGMEYDVKSRRRLHEMGDSLFFCLHNFGSATMTYSYFIRTLVMLP